MGKYRRVLLKLGGESLAGPGGSGIDPERADDLAGGKEQYQRPDEGVDQTKEDAKEQERSADINNAWYQRLKADARRQGNGDCQYQRINEDTDG